MKKLLSATLLTAAIAAPAFAAGNDHNGLYVFGNAGDVQTDVRLANGAHNDEHDRNEAWEAGVGYRINQNVAVEGSYFKANRPFNAQGNEVKLDAYRVAALGIVPLNDQLEVFGKVSANSINYQLNGNTDTNLALGAGVGAQYHLNQNLSLRGEVETLGKAKHTDVAESKTVNAVKVGVNYRF